MPKIRIEPAERRHVPLILHFIKSLAEYERLAHEVVADEQRLTETLFGSAPCAEVLIAYLDDEPAGFALFFQTYSTFLAQPGIYLEDLFVEPRFRGKGVGKALLLRLARLTQDRNGGRLEWSVLDWNQPSIDFYRSLGAVPLDDWTKYRLTGESLRKLAETL